jgi:hypothetical protein
MEEAEAASQAIAVCDQIHGVPWRRDQRRLADPPVAPRGAICHDRVAHARSWQKRGSGGGEGASWEGEVPAPRCRISNRNAIAVVATDVARGFVSTDGLNRSNMPTVLAFDALQLGRRTLHGMDSAMADAWCRRSRRMATPAALVAALQ